MDLNCNDYSIIEQIAAKYNATIKHNEEMKQHTTFRIGGPCDVMIDINCEALLCELISECRKTGIRYFVIGKGSNLLVSDKGLRGVVLHLGSDFSSIRVDDDIIECDAGASLSGVCQAALENSLQGLEFAYGIPGSVGGAVYMNAGAYGGEMKDVVLSCRYIDGDEIKEMPVCRMGLGYRESIFADKNYCITSVRIKLKKGDKAEIKNQMDTLMQKRKDKQPLEYPSAGSTFKRPEGDYAGRLIEVCGLKGTACGGAEVSTKHAGFVINKNNATCSDVLGVIEKVKQTVKKETGVELHCEVLLME
ncbi:MAG: UDP-N-acetylmuramate dehydrogenase [Ruminiclostridium sp.]|nr:UDP-N-acetylmuramate dehydrogenase [Ruminiclostridium sp.]